MTRRVLTAFAVVAVLLTTVGHAQQWGAVNTAVALVVLTALLVGLARLVESVVFGTARLFARIGRDTPSDGR